MKKIKEKASSLFFPAEPGCFSFLSVLCASAIISALMKKHAVVLNKFTTQ